MKIISTQEINTGRQLELDHTKGFLMLAIMVIHAFQLMGNAEAKTGNVYKIIFGFFMVTGACLYLFSMGFGMAYNKKKTPADMAVNGLKQLRNQLLSNICYGVCVFVPAFLLKLAGILTEESFAGVFAFGISMLLFINIFYIAGMISLVMAGLKKIKLPLWGYGVAALIVAALTPYLATVTVGNRIVDAVLDTAFGSTGNVSFCFFPYIAFTASGYIFGMILRRVQDKTAFYRKTACIAGILVGISAIVFFVQNPALDTQYEIIWKSYTYPGILKLIISDAGILLLLAVMFFLRNTLEKCNWLNNKILFIAKHISKYYAIHIGIYIFLLAFTGYQGIGNAGCIIISVPVTFVTDAMVKWYVNSRKKK